ncbi:MAG: GHKL domain-containing protein [Lachnospiraceae bacterium]|nr:GHKL domain-containing protein [Lachnospiraceae bacterium]
MMGNKKKLQQENELLEEKYNRLFSENSQIRYELDELKSEKKDIENKEEEIKQLHNSMRALKHDMKNHLLVIASYLQKEDVEAAKDYTSKIIDKLNMIHSYIETGNSLMNHILNEKLEIARKAKIQIKAEVENLSFERMASLDFSSLLGNLLDNGIEACMKEKEKELIVQILARRDYEVIMVKNKIEKSVLDSNPKLISSKENKEEHGKGIPQIKSIIDKYGGMSDFYEEDGYFVACAFIPAQM